MQREVKVHLNIGPPESGAWRGVVGVLQPIIYAVLVNVGEALTLLARRLDQNLAKLQALLGRQLREDFLCGLLVHVGWEVGGYLLIARSRLLVGDRLRSLPEVIDEVLVVLTRSAEGVALGLHVVTSESSFKPTEYLPRWLPPRLAAQTSQPHSVPGLVL
jgi:hypothetical protein